jgi:hypothetical protein
MTDIDFPYVVLRNFENLPHSVQVGGHSDLDLLVYDLDHWLEIFPKASREFPHPRVRFFLPIGAGNVYMDVRSVGDGYYPEDFSRAILETKEWNGNGFFTPNPIHHRIALAYHAVHHKNENTYQRYIGDATVAQLLEALKSSRIGWVEPSDRSVGRFHPYWKGATAVVSREGDSVTKRQVSYGRYNLTANELRILSGVSSVHFPKVLSAKDNEITMEDCGAPLSVDNLPLNWKEQLVQIALALKANNIQHRDIKPDNLMVKDGIIKLIDFGWARFYDDPQDTPPSCLGYPYKPSYGFDDNYSMKMVIKQLEHQFEENLYAVA